MDGCDDCGAGLGYACTCDVPKYCGECGADTHYECHCDE
jgi:hypothetical protein